MLYQYDIPWPPPRVQASLSTNVTVRRSAPMAACPMAVKGQVANFEKPVSFKAKWCVSFLFTIAVLYYRKGSLVEKLPSYGDLKMQRVQLRKATAKVTDQ